jgi:hypothetical protein
VRSKQFLARAGSFGAVEPESTSHFPQNSWKKRMERVGHMQNAAAPFPRRQRLVFFVLGAA